MDLLTFLQTTLVDRLDYTLAYMAVTLLLYFYGNDIVRRFIRVFQTSRTTRFIIFLLLVFFGINVLLLLLVNLILDVTSWYKWLIIAGLILWAFIKFEIEVQKN